jgi:ketosteroid isomerase-like protein
MSEENLAVAKAFYEAYNARDSDALERLLHPDAEITTLSARGGLGGEWSPGTTRQYFEQLEEAWAGLRIEIDDYREVGACVVALGGARAAGTSSHVEVASEFAAVLVIADSRIMLIDSYNNREEALDAAGRREQEAGP